MKKANSMNESDLTRILKQYPDLCTWGFRWSGLKEGFSRSFDLDLLNKICEWIKRNCEPTKTIRSRYDSYQWKHFCESHDYYGLGKWRRTKYEERRAAIKGIGEYVSNGHFIVAAIYLGYHIKPYFDSPNCGLNMTLLPSSIHWI